MACCNVAQFYTRLASSVSRPRLNNLPATPSVDGAELVGRPVSFVWGQKEPFFPPKNWRAPAPELALLSIRS